ncbi:MAG: protein-glutamate O-methyltransferase CheR [Vicinamibacterales bacterium]
MAETLLLRRGDMTAIAQLVYEQSGIRLTEAKTALVNARLQKRVREQGFRTFGAYVKHVRTEAGGVECHAMIDALTTNKTSFFREPGHFSFLVEHVLPEVLNRGSASIAGWSAGCATGEEPYSIVMALLNAFQGRVACTIDIVASDVSPTALATAVRGVYPLERVQNVPHETLRRYMERGIGEQEGLTRVRDAVRRLIRFEEANLLDARILARQRDFIWCRNTLMYFDHAARQQALAHLIANLAPSGYLFVSHAENLSGLEHEHGLVRTAPAIYRRMRA